MALPLFDDIDLPPNTTLVDVNKLDDDKRVECQGAALEYWIEETGESFDDFQERDWDDNEGIFAVVESGVTIGVAIITDVEDF